MYKRTVFYLVIVTVMMIASACAPAATTVAPAPTSVAAVANTAAPAPTSAAPAATDTSAPPTTAPAAAPTGTGLPPIKIGISLSLSGDFSADGQAFQQGYQMWADEINQKGGLLGRQVVLDILSDASSPDQVQVNYQKLITVDHCDLVFGPFSSLLTKPASAW